ncbi:MAG: acyltransferase family protein, partial [Gemmiger sp.]
MTVTEISVHSRPRRDYIDALKGLGIILVVLGHFEEYYRGSSPIFNGSFECIYMFHMAIFCICSGMVAKFNLRKLVSQQLWLYLISQALMLAFRVIVLHEDPATQGGIVACLLLPWRHMWYLYALLFWEWTVPLLRAVVQRFRFAGACGCFALAIVFGLWSGTVDWPLSLGRVTSFYPFYAFGVLFAPQIDRWYKTTVRRWPLRLALAGAFFAVYGNWFLSVLRAPEPVYEGGRIFQGASYAADHYTTGDRAAFYVVGILTVLTLAGLVGSSKWLASLGKRTLPVYILHMPAYALLIEAGVFEAPNPRGELAILSWLAFGVMGCVCAFASAPVCTVVNGAANL